MPKSKTKEKTKTTAKKEATKKEEDIIVTFDELRPLNNYKDYIRTRMMNSQKFSMAYLFCVASYQQGLKPITAPTLENRLHITRDLAWKYLEILTRGEMLHKVIQGKKALYLPKTELNKTELIQLAKKTIGVKI